MFSVAGRFGLPHQQEIGLLEVRLTEVPIIGFL
jgi:hypothetical protein